MGEWAAKASKSRCLTLKVWAAPILLTPSRTSSLASCMLRSGPPMTSVLYRPGTPVKVCDQTNGGLGRFREALSGDVLMSSRPSGMLEWLKMPAKRLDHCHLAKTPDSVLSGSKGYMLLLVGGMVINSRLALTSFLLPLGPLTMSFTPVASRTAVDTVLEYRTSGPSWPAMAAYRAELLWLEGIKNPPVDRA